MEDPKDLKIKEIKIEHDENILSESFSQNLKVSSTSNVTISQHAKISCHHHHQLIVRFKRIARLAVARR